jgi:hypothetical protein
VINGLKILVDALRQMVCVNALSNAGRDPKSPAVIGGDNLIITLAKDFLIRIMKVSSQLEV